MGFSSAGAGLGCSFFFELPLYSQPPGLTSSLVATRDPSHLTASSRSLALRTPPPSPHHFPVAEDRRGPVKVGGDVALVYQFSADKHGSQVSVKAEASSVVFDHVFHQMLLSSHSKGENEGLIKIVELVT